MTTANKIFRAFNKNVKPTDLENSYDTTLRISRTVMPPEPLSFNDTMIHIHNTLKATQLPQQLKIEL